MPSTAAYHRLPKVIRCLQFLVDNNPNLGRELEDVINTVISSEARNERMLDNREEIISQLRASLIKSKRSATNQAKELSKAKAALSAQRELQSRIQDLQASLAVVKQQKDNLFNDLTDRSKTLDTERWIKEHMKRDFDSELKRWKNKYHAVYAKLQNSMQETDYARDMLGRLHREQDSLEQRDLSLIIIIASLRKDKLDHEKELNDVVGGHGVPLKKRKAAEMSKDTDQGATSRTPFTETKTKTEFVLRGMTEAEY